MEANVNSGQALVELADLREQFLAHVAEPIQLPEVALTLDYGARRGSRVRVFTFLHQMCTLHRESFARSTQIKHLYLIDAFLEMAKAENPIALYAIARSMFELDAFLHEVRARLQNTTLYVTDQTWQPLGEKFFGLIVRARYATTVPGYLDLLSSQGVPASRLKPFNIMHCVRGLAAEPGHSDAEVRYNALCDFVHHNLGTMTTTISGSGVSDAARSAGGGMIVSDGEMTISQYEYPVRGAGDRALDELALGFLNDVRACLEWLNGTPWSPFDSEMITRMTGTPLGVEVLRQP